MQKQNLLTQLLQAYYEVIFLQFYTLFFVGIDSNVSFQDFWIIYKFVVLHASALWTKLRIYAYLL